MITESEHPLARGSIYLHLSVKQTGSVTDITNTQPLFIISRVKSYSIVRNGEDDVPGIRLQFNLYRARLSMVYYIIHLLLYDAEEHQF